MRPKTVIIDIDGVLLKHHGNLSRQVTEEPVLLPGVLERLNEWDAKGYYLVLMTGRKESLRRETELTLTELGVFYDQLVMGVTGGTRILVNDLKTDSDEPTAVAVNLERNKGVADLCL